MDRRGNSNCTLPLLRRWLKQTEGRQHLVILVSNVQRIQYARSATSATSMSSEERLIIRSQWSRGDWNRQEGDLFIIWPPSILVSSLPQVLSRARSLLKNYLYFHLRAIISTSYRLIFALKPGEIIFKVPPTISQSLTHIILLLRPLLVNSTKSLSSESPDCPSLDLPIA